MNYNDVTHYYSKTAYNSNKYYKRSTIQKPSSAIPPAYLRTPLPWTDFDMDYDFYQGISYTLSIYEDEFDPLRDPIRHSHYIVQTAMHQHGVYTWLFNMAALIAVGLLCLGIAIFLFGPLRDGVELLQSHQYLIIIVCYIVWLIHKQYSTTINDYDIFHRPTGMVQQIFHDDDDIITPFYQWQAFYYYFNGPYSSHRHYLLLIHPKTERIITVANHRSAQYVIQHWQWLQNFMDTSKPLPNSKDLNPTRHWDPISK